MNDNDDNYESEFGQGLTYNLGLFLAHQEKIRELERVYKRAGVTDLISSAKMWFNGASDHLYDLVIPETLPQDLQERLKIFQEKCLEWGHDFSSNKEEKITIDDVWWALHEAKELLRLIDESYGVKTIKGQWE